MLLFFLYVNLLYFIIGCEEKEKGRGGEKEKIMFKIRYKCEDSISVFSSTINNKDQMKFLIESNNHLQENVEYKFLTKEDIYILNNKGEKMDGVTIEQFKENSYKNGLISYDLTLKADKDGEYHISLSNEKINTNNDYTGNFVWTKDTVRPKIEIKLKNTDGNIIPNGTTIKKWDFDTEFIIEIFSSKPVCSKFEFVNSSEKNLFDCNCKKIFYAIDVQEGCLSMLRTVIEDGKKSNVPLSGLVPIINIEGNNGNYGWRSTSSNYFNGYAKFSYLNGSNYRFASGDIINVNLQIPSDYLSDIYGNLNQESNNLNFYLEEK